MEPTKQPGFLNEYISKKFEVSMEPTKQPGFSKIKNLESGSVVPTKQPGY